MSQNTDPLTSDLVIYRLEDLNSIDAGEWNNLSNTDNPFLRYEFLHGLEQHNCLDEHGWSPCHLAAYSGKKLVGALPLYAKTNSYGEFVFDWLWADAYERAGGRYYPKLVSAIPFTPVQGPRILTDIRYPDTETVKDKLIQEVIEITKSAGISSFHCLFPDNKDDVTAYKQNGLLLRKGVQFHWHNRGYDDFNDFLALLTSKKRKQIKRERRQVNENGLKIEVLEGAQISEFQWQVFYDFYCSTFYRRWGSPRLNYDFFLSLTDKLPEQTLLLLAKYRNDYVAGAFAMKNSHTLYGRHWGCNEHFSNLHFELCYYQTINYCIEHGLNVLDAGVQGEHKLSRGFEPVATCSVHWIQHNHLREAVNDFVDRETLEIDAYIDNLNLHLPYKDKTD